MSQKKQDATGVSTPQVTQEQLQALLNQLQALQSQVKETPTTETNEAVLKLWQSDAYKAEKSAAKRAHMTMKTRAANDEAYAAEIKAARKAAAEKAGATRKAAAIQQSNALTALKAQVQALMNGGQQ